MGILTTILSIILFLVALGVLVSIHELGHLIAAKSFNVYCNEYAIGFGPKFIRYKRKGGETSFVVGILPLGGYVSMYGEGIDLPDGVSIPRSRSLEGIKRWKRIIIMAAGIVMNFVLAYVIFFISASCFPNLTDFYINVFSINDEATFKSHVKMEDGSEISDELLTYFNEKPAVEVDVLSIDINLNNGKTQTIVPNYYFFNSSSISYNGTSSYVLAFDLTNFSYNDTEISQFIKVYEGFTYEVGKDTLPANYVDVKRVINNEVVPFEEGIVLNLPVLDENYNLKEVEIPASKEVEALLTFRSTDIENEVFNKVRVTFKKDTLGEKYERVGMGPNAEYKWLGWDSFRVAGEQWVNSTTLISDALIQLFTSAEAWNNVGGPIAIFTQTTSILANNPFYIYLNTWGVISVNLALFNLLPFPGLDGWQILVEIVEGIVNGGYQVSKKFRKNKNKNNEKEVIENSAIDNSDKVSNNEISNCDNLASNEAIVSEVKDDQVSINKDTTLVVGNDENKDSNETNEHIEYDDEWHIPQKVKNIMSSIGLILLFGLFFVIIIKDIIGLF